MKRGLLTPSFRQAIDKITKSPKAVVPKESYPAHSEFLLSDFVRDVSELMSLDNSEEDLNPSLNSFHQQREPVHIPENNKAFEREDKQELVTKKFKGEDALVLTSYELSVRNENHGIGAYRDPEAFESATVQQAQIRRAEALDVFSLFEYPSLSDDEVMVQHKYQNFSDSSESITNWYLLSDLTQ